MLKLLLYAYVSLIAVAGYAQSTIPLGTGATEQTVEDSNNIVNELISVLQDNGKLTLNWKVTGSLPRFFAVERSDNGKTFEMLEVLNNPSVQRYYKWTDDSPKKGRSFYRIRYSSELGDSVFSKMITVSIAGEVDVKFYPNPVDHILIVRCDSPIDVQISDANGRIRITEPRVVGLHTINVSSLEKGIYLIRFTNKLTTIMSQEKLVKN